MAGRASKEASSMNQAGRVSRMDTIGTDTPISKAKNARARKGSATPAMKQKKNKTSVVEDPDDDNGNTGNTGNKKQNLTKKRKKGPLDCGDNIELSNVTYQIQKLIRNPGPNAEYYLTEGTAEKVLRLSPKGKNKLKYCFEILKKVRETNTASEKWFYLDAVDSGQYQKFDYLITSSYNIQLYEVHRALNRVFTRDCVMNIAYQTLESIRALHNAGFINRNIKPASFSIGPTSKDHLVCMSDFRITRKHIDEATQKPRAIRPKIEYIGTARYASISSLKGLEQGRRDDLEAWLYMIYDLFDYNSAVPWKKQTKKENLAMKERLMQHAEPVVYLVVPEGFKKIVDLLYPMTYESAPDYSKIFEILDEICQTNNFDKTKCDWVGKFNNSMVSQKAIDDAANKTEDNICSGADDFEFGPKKKPKITRKMMNPGDQIKNGRFVWKIVNLLGSGGFGDVYRVFSETDKKKKNYALKTESEDGKKMMLRLKVEMQVLMAIQDDRKTNKKAVNKHFVEFVDRGKSDELKCKFIVMSIVGPSLDDCRKKYRVDLSHRSTPYNIAIQTLEAVRDLHNLGFLHRDIKPANFAVGIGSEEPVVYMLDFGICRMFIDPKTKIHRAPRKKVKFLGTLRFASRACLKCEDQGRKDDLECWLYMVFDILDEDDGIPWKNISDRDKILGVKMAFFLMKLSIVYENISRQMKTIVKYVDSLEYQSTPDYEYIIKSLLAVAEHCKCPVKDRRKVEWAGKLRKEDLEAIKRFDENSDDESEESAGSNESE